VSLNPRSLWLDLWALKSLAERVSELYRKHDGSAGEVERLARLALDIYRGDFLTSDDEPWIEPARNRLRSRFGQMLTDAGENDKAFGLRESVRERGASIQRHL
jgi:hypothetical protein